MGIIQQQEQHLVRNALLEVTVVRLAAYKNVLLDIIQTQEQHPVSYAHLDIIQHKGQQPVNIALLGNIHQ